MLVFGTLWKAWKALISYQSQLFVLAVFILSKWKRNEKKNVEKVLRWKLGIDQSKQENEWSVQMVAERGAGLLCSTIVFAGEIFPSKAEEV